MPHHVSMTHPLTCVFVPEFALEVYEVSRDSVTKQVATVYDDRVRHVIS